MSINHNNANTSAAHDPADLLKFATACTYNAIKSLNRLHPSEHLRVILSFQKPEYLEDATQEYITSLLESGINLNQSVESIKTDAAETIAHVTANGKEINALQRATGRVQEFIRQSTNQTYGIKQKARIYNDLTGKMEAKTVTVPNIAIDFFNGDNYAIPGSLQINDDTDYNLLNDGYRERIREAAKTDEKAAIMIDIYNALQDGYTQREISESLTLPTSTVYDCIKKIRAIFADDFAALDTLESRNK